MMMMMRYSFIPTNRAAVPPIYTCTFWGEVVMFEACPGQAVTRISMRVSPSLA